MGMLPLVPFIRNGGVPVGGYGVAGSLTPEGKFVFRAIGGI